MAGSLPGTYHTLPPPSYPSCSRVALKISHAAIRRNIKSETRGRAAHSVGLDSGCWGVAPRHRDAFPRVY
ncbi:uncharacterized protein P884DRAFT_265613 [Thermothelomyces heterothallicus CBS 202.75]|uniref:uncharacterized protein n=1 Tax=Thermothelomyces heterothallicus CBS 202.75 TaxID=1149848 RepID=UPI003741EAA4